MSDPKKAKSATPDQESALFTTDNMILPDRAAANKLPTFTVEQLPTPLRESASVVQILVRFDAKQPLPDDAMAQVQSAIARAKNRALIVDCMTPSANASWAGCK